MSNPWGPWTPCPVWILSVIGLVGVLRLCIPLLEEALLTRNGSQTNLLKFRFRPQAGKVQTDSTHPPEGLFTRNAETIARSLASKKVSPKGPGSGMRMLNYFINRGGKGLSNARREELNRAKKLLSKRIEREKKHGKKPA